MNRERRVFLFVSIATLTLSTLLFFGLYEVRSVKSHLEKLLLKEAEMLSDHLVGEINLFLTYLELSKRTELPLTGFDEIVLYEDLAIEETTRSVLDAIEAGNKSLPVKNFIILEKDGRIVKRGGDYLELERILRDFLASRERVFLREEGTSFIVGMKLEKAAIIFSIGREDLDRIKRYYILKDLLERESEKFRVSGINIYDPKGNPYIEMLKPGPDHLVFRKEINLKHMPNYKLEILLLRDLIDDTVRSVKAHLIASLVVLFILAVATAYGIFIIERRVDRRMLDLERDLAKKEKLISLGMLASGMAHEIRNPLNALILFLEKLKRDIASGQKPDEKALDLVSSEIRRINKLVEEFLSLSRGNKKKERRKLRPLVEDVMGLLEEKAKEKRITLENLVEPEFEVNVHEDGLKQSLMNFILNSIEAIENHGYVKVWAKRKGKGTYITVEDNGKGIDEKDLERVFDFHFTTKDKGLGLGLPISYMIIKEQGGDIRIESEKGKGTRLTIFLPD